MAKKTLIRKMDKVFSEYIRKRDSKDGYFNCCSCGLLKEYSQADAGHFINRRWMSTRWREDNVHAQCRSCNRFDEGNSVGYTFFMINKYGKKHVEYLTALKQETMLYSDFDLELMIKKYKEKTK